jgi:hypothetical protein
MRIRRRCGTRSAGGKRCVAPASALPPQTTPRVGTPRQRLPLDPRLIQATRRCAESSLTWRRQREPSAGILEAVRLAVPRSPALLARLGGRRGSLETLPRDLEIDRTGTPRCPLGNERHVLHRNSRAAAGAQSTAMRFRMEALPFRHHALRINCLQFRPSRIFAHAPFSSCTVRRTSGNKETSQLQWCVCSWSRIISVCSLENTDGVDSKAASLRMAPAMCSRLVPPATLLTASGAAVL